MPQGPDLQCSDAFQKILKVLAGALIAVFSARAQTGSGQLLGSVSDTTGRPVPGVSLRLENRSTGYKAEALSGDDGRWSFQAVSPGTYSLTAAKSGFRPLIREHFRISVADRIGLDLTLTVGDISQELLVTADAPLLQTATGTMQFALSHRTATELPLDGRNFIPLIATLPGVTLPPGQVLPRISGSRPRTSEYLYDGISVLQPEPGQVAYFPIPDAMEEFRVQTNSYSAEYGRSTGGIIQAVTRSGGNEFHGTAFGFVRHEALNARNVFATTQSKPLFRRGQYGGVLGGPLRRDRLFVFGAWQRTELRNGVVRVSTVPTSAEREGRFGVPVFDPAGTAGEMESPSRLPFPRNTIPAGRVDSLSAQLLDRFPLPNVFTASGAEAVANNYRRTAEERVRADQFDTRLDAVASSAHRLFARYSYLRDRSLPATPLPDGSGRILSGITGNTLARGDSLATEHVWTVSPRAVSQARFGYTRRAVVRGSGSSGPSVAVPNLPAGTFPNLLPVIDLAGYQQLGAPAGANARFSTAVTQLAGTYSLQTGVHGLKAGGDLRWFGLDVLQPLFPAGAFSFDSALTAGLTPSGTPAPGTGSSVASFLLGQVQSFTADFQAEPLQPRAAVYEFFLQSDWNVTRRLTLNAGVRYTLNRPSVEA